MELTPTVPITLSNFLGGFFHVIIIFLMDSLNSRVLFGVEEYRCINDVIGLRGKEKKISICTCILFGGVCGL